jgi:hypothetical protein
VAAAAALLGATALLLPSRCQVNELGHHEARETGDLALGEAPRAPQQARFAEACGTAVVPGDLSPIRRKPYVQKVTSDSAVVMWTGVDLAAPAVVVWPASDPEASEEVAAIADPGAPLSRGQQFELEIPLRRPGAIHCYRVEDGAEILAGPYGVTAAPPADGAPVRIAALGDLGFRTSDQRAVLAQLEQVEFELALLTGDIGYPDGALDEYEYHVFDVYAPLMRSVPFFPTPGNHDYRTAGGAPFRQVFALPENGGPHGRERWYSFDWGIVHVVVLDSETLTVAQEAWLEADLLANRRPWVIAILHRPPFSAGHGGPSLPVRFKLHPILARHQVPLVLAGHEHSYERRLPVDGVTYVITGGGGRGTRPVRAEPGTGFSQQVAHHLYIEVDRDLLQLWAIDATGKTFDTLRLPRGPGGG